MTSNSFASNGIGMPTSGLAARRAGGQNIKPLSFDAAKTSTVTDNGAPTPRTSRSHLLAGLRTAPKTATATSFGSSQTSMPQQPQQQYARSNQNVYTAAQDAYNAPKTAMPQFATQGPQGNQGQPIHSLAHLTQQYTAEQVLAPPELQFDMAQEQMDPSVYAQLVATNTYLAQQQQRLQQQLRDVQAAAQQFQGLSIGQQLQLQQQQQQQYAMYGHTQGRNTSSSASAQPNVYAFIDPSTGQPTYVVDQSVAGQVNPQYNDQSQYAQYAALQQQQQQLQQVQQLQQLQQLQALQQQQLHQNTATPRVQVSPPPEPNGSAYRSNSPPKRYESPSDHTPLPPPSANAFRRGHKRASSVANNNGLSVNVQDAQQKGPKTAAFPITPMTGGYGPGQARAGEHPIRQPRGPPSFDELVSKPTAKHEGSKNFAARTRRSAVHNLMRAGKERRKGASSSTGSMSPVSESAAESETPITDNESESGRSGSGSLSGEVESSLPSSRTSASGSWGAIGSDRPSSREKARELADYATEGDGSFASVFKNAGQGSDKSAPTTDAQRKAPRLVLTRSGPTVAA